MHIRENFKSINQKDQKLPESYKFLIFYFKYFCILEFLFVKFEFLNMINTLLTGLFIVILTLSFIYIL